MSNSALLSTLCALALLAGCAGSNTSAELAAPAPQPTAQPAPSGPPPKATLTPEEAKAQCWMKFENDKRVKNIDARLILVEKCVDETMRGQLVQAPPQR